MDNEVYDVSKYTDQELYNILDLMNPTDRELEAKIIQQINRYENMNNIFGNKFVKFFNEIYKRFFEIDEEEVEEGEEENVYYITEGLESGTFPTTDTPTPQDSTIQNTNIQGQYPTQSGPSSVNDKNTPLSANPQDITTVAQSSLGNTSGNSGLGYTKNIDFSKGNLNPILKETIKRVISIDSQFRDKTVYQHSTDFTFNLSDVLQDVVSLKLYSVQIPYTWYTINNNFGANFFFIKGNSAGINNGNFDYKIVIKAGNYSASDLITTINTSLQNIKTSNPDVSFGNTGISYDNNKINATINFYINNRFNESYYYLNFPFWTTPQDPSFVSQTLSIPGFFGYNNQVYTPFTIYSSPFTNIDISTNRFSINSSNNTLYIYNYKGPSELSYAYDASHTIFPDISSNTIYNIIPITLDLSGSFTRSAILTDLNNILTANTFLTDSSMSIFDVSNINSVYNKEFKLNIKLNRSVASNLQDSKTVVIFPSGDSQLWLGSTSSFYYSDPVNEINNVISETPNQITTYYINSNPYIYISCIRPFYGTVDTSLNDYRVDVSNSGVTGYTLDQYLGAINTGMNIESTHATSVGDYFQGIVDVENSYTTMKIGLQQNFSTIDYYIDISGTILDSSRNGLNPNGICNLDLTNLDVSGRDQGFTTTTMTYQSQFNIRSSYFLGTILEPIKVSSIANTSKFSSGNYAFKTNNTVPILDISFGNGNSAQTLTAFQNAINSAFANSSTYGINLKNTNVSFTENAGVVTCIFTINISSILTENDYILTMYDPSASIWVSSNNSWYNYLGFIDPSYVLQDATGSNFAIVKGTKIIASNEIVLDALNNYFYVKAILNSNGGVYTSTGNNDVKISLNLSDGTYPRETIITAINTALAGNAITSGSSITTYNIPITIGSVTSNNNYTKIRLNINKTFKTSDYKIVFYDLYSFSHCNFGNSKSLQNVTPDATLGWIIGFRDETSYIIEPSNVSYNTNFVPPTTYYSIDTNTAYTYDTSTNIATITGDTTIGINLYNYFLIILDDYTQNHLNDGLVTITSTDSSIPLPSYASRTLTRCNPLTSVKYISTGSALNNNVLTSKQVYAANQVLNNKNLTKTIYSPGPFVQDIFGIIPMKTAGLTNGSSYIEFGGTLQIQERSYFGPVNIHRMSIKLLNDKGGVLDLNGSNWSFSLIAEQLYNPSKF